MLSSADNFQMKHTFKLTRDDQSINQMEYNYQDRTLYLGLQGQGQSQEVMVLQYSG